MDDGNIVTSNSSNNAIRYWIELRRQLPTRTSFVLLLYDEKHVSVPSRSAEQQFVFSDYVHAERSSPTIRQDACACYRTLMDLCASGPENRAVIVRSWQETQMQPVFCRKEEVCATIILPHRGDRRLLQNYLAHDVVARPGKTQLVVMLDEEFPDQFVPLFDSVSNCVIYAATTPPYGPYRLRHEGAKVTNTPILFFQDSDDFPTADRFYSLFHSLQNTCSDADILGSNEVRLDEDRKRAIGVVYPADVNAALIRGPAFPQLFPTTAIRRCSYFSSGGVASELAFAFDTQFLLRAFFSLRIMNTNRFLYIRRIRRGSLTTSSSTGIGSTVRSNLDQLWKSDFVSVRGSERKLSDSSLAANCIDSQTFLVLQNLIK